jgi:hypothetical protein
LKVHASNVLSPHPAINIAVSLRAIRSVKEALESLKKLIDGELFLDASFFDNLTEDVELGGLIMIDLSFGARISRSSVTTPTSDAPSVEVFLLVNDLSATAYVKASSLTMDFPLNLPGEESLSPVVPLSLVLENGSFNMGLHINLDEPRNITDLFKNGAFNYGGRLDVTFPVEYSVDDIDLGVTLKMSDSDIFNPLPPVIEYELDICPIVNELKNAVTNIAGDIMDAITTAINTFTEIETYINFDQVVEPLVDYINTTLSGFSNSLVTELGSCGTRRRFLQGEGGTSSSLSNTIRVATDNFNSNSSLNSAGITIYANIKPYFDGKEFAVGVDFDVSVIFEQVRNLLSYSRFLCGNAVCIIFGVICCYRALLEG